MQSRLATISALATALAIASLAAVSTAAATPVAVYGAVGPSFAITLKTAAGVPVRALRAGRTYTFVVRDRSDVHNFHLVGPGVNAKSPVASQGTYRWTIRLRAGTYKYRCDPHAPEMHGSFTAR